MSFSKDFQQVQRYCACIFKIARYYIYSQRTKNDFPLVEYAITKFTISKIFASVKYAFSS